jgi:hypothetical protein
MIDSHCRVMRVLFPGIFLLAFSVFLLEAPVALGQSSSQTSSTQNHPAESAGAAAWAQHVRQNDAEAKVPDRVAMLRGADGRFRANNDLLYYHLVVRVDPERKTLSGSNTIRFRMLTDGSRIQLDLQEPLQIEKILLGTTPLKYERDSGVRSSSTSLRPCMQAKSTRLTSTTPANL